MESILHLTGPVFLLFYLAIVGLGLFLVRVRLVRGSVEMGAEDLFVRPDAYLIAFIVGGRIRIVQAVMIHSFLRGWIQHETTISRCHTAVRLATRVEQIPEGVERRVAACFLSAVPVVTPFLPGRVDLSEYELRAMADKLIPTPRAKRLQLARLSAIALPILGLGVAKCVSAVSRGHHNIGLLVLTMLAAGPAFAILGWPRRLTHRGALTSKAIEQVYYSCWAQHRHQLPVLAMAAAGPASLYCSPVAYLQPMFPQVVIGNIGVSSLGDLTGHARRGNASSDGGWGGCGGSGCGGGGCGGGGCGGCGS